MMNIQNKYSLIIVIEKNPKKYRDIIIFQYRTGAPMGGDMIIVHHDVAHDN